MQWIFRLTHPSIKQLQPDRPIGLATILWSIAFFIICGCVGAAGSLGAIPPSISIFGAASIIAIVWLATYSWVGDGHQTAADWLMVLVGIVGAWIGIAATTAADSNWILIGILPITGAFRGNASLVILSQFQPGASGNANRWLASLPLVLLGSIGFALLGFWWSMTQGWGKSIAILAIGLAMALPLGSYFFVAYSLLPSLFINGIERVIQQLPNPIDADGNIIDRDRNLPDAVPTTPPTSHAEMPISLDEWAKSPQLKIQFLWSIPLVLIPLLFSSAIYWAIVCGLGGWIVDAIGAIDGISTPIEWGWNWLQAWAVTWLFTLVVAIVKIFQNPLQWVALLHTTSILGRSLLMPTAVIWGGVTSTGALLSVAWGGSLGTILSATVWGLRRSLRGEYIFWLLSGIAVAGMLCGWALVKHKIL